MNSDENGEFERDHSIVGQMTGGVAHEFNNVLQGIIGLAEMLDADPTLPKKARVGMKAIKRLSQNATRMIQSISAADSLRGTITSEAGDITEVSESAKPAEDEKERKTILVVEDDQLVLNVITGMLKYLGYSTISAHNGIEAINVFNANDNRVGLVITDMVMPQMGGLDLVKELHTRNPDVQVLLMTGYLQEDLEINLEEAGFTGMLEKPMTAERLRQAVEPIMKSK